MWRSRALGILCIQMTPSLITLMKTISATQPRLAHKPWVETAIIRNVRSSCETDMLPYTLLQSSLSTVSLFHFLCLHHDKNPPRPHLPPPWLLCCAGSNVATGPSGALLTSICHITKLERNTQYMCVRGMGRGGGGGISHGMGCISHLQHCLVIKNGWALNTTKNIQSSITMTRTV